MLMFIVAALCVVGLAALALEAIGVTAVLFGIAALVLRFA